MKKSIEIQSKKATIKKAQTPVVAVRKVKLNYEKATEKMRSNAVIVARCN